MAERLRPVQMKFYVTEEEKNFIYKKMSLIGVKNLSAYLRKMAIDGQLVRIETTDLDEICRQISGIAKNINQIAKRINATDNIFSDDIREMKKKVAGEMPRCRTEKMMKKEMYFIPVPFRISIDA